MSDASGRGEAVLVADAGVAPVTCSVSTLQSLAVRGTVWTGLGLGGTQVLRFVGNIIVARLLFPEAFGIMGTVFAVLTGLTMFSDIGLGPSIMQHARGEDAAFLRTAWSVQLVRGVLIWLLCAPLGMVVSWSTGEAMFLWLVPVAGFTCVIQGVYSVSIFTYKRRLAFGRVTLLNFVAGAVATGVMIACAYVWPSVWALLTHAFVTVVITAIGSFFFMPEIRMSWQWEREAVSELIRFGRWIFIATALTFLVARLDIFILGATVGMGVLGVYATAKNYSFAALEAVGMLASTVLLPVYARFAERGADVLRSQTFRLRAGLLAVFLPPLWALTVYGDSFVRLLYDDRYHDAGWMIQVLAAGAIVATISNTIDPVLLARGDSFRYMLQLASRLALQIVGMAGGAYLAGVKGFIIGLAVADILNYPILVALVRKHEAWLPRLDAAALALSAAIIGLGWYFVR